MNSNWDKQLDEEFRYLQRKKKVVIEFAEVRLKVSFEIHQPPKGVPSDCHSELEHHVSVQPHQIPCRPSSPHLAYVQGMLGRLLWHKRRQRRLTAGRMRSVPAQE